MYLLHPVGLQNPLGDIPIVRGTIRFGFGVLMRKGQVFKDERDSLGLTIDGETVPNGPVDWRIDDVEADEGNDAQRTTRQLCRKLRAPRHRRRRRRRQLDGEFGDFHFSRQHKTI